MNASFSITRHLMVWLTLGTALFWLLSVGLGAMVMREEFDEVFDSALEEAAQRLMSLLIEQQFESRDVAGTSQVEVSPSSAKREYLTYQLRDQTGRVLLHSHDAPSGAFEVPLRPGFFDDEEHRTYTVSAVNDTLFLQVADPLRHRREAMIEGARTLVLPILGLIPVSALATWLIIGRALRPISLLQEEISQRGGGNLRPLGLGAMPNELAGITASIDTLLLRLQAALQAERDFAAPAHMSYVLRSPARWRKRSACSRNCLRAICRHAHYGSRVRSTPSPGCQKSCCSLRAPIPASALQRRRSTWFPSCVWLRKNSPGQAGTMCVLSLICRPASDLSNLST